MAAAAERAPLLVEALAEGEAPLALAMLLLEEPDADAEAPLGAAAVEIAAAVLIGTEALTAAADPEALVLALAAALPIVK